MIMNIKKILFNNIGLKLTALFIALFVWIQITGKERLYVEKTLDIDVEYVNVSENIDVRLVRPEKVKIKVRGTSSEMKEILSENFKVRIDLRGIRESMRLNVFTEDYLITPEDTRVVSIHPKMIEMKVEEFMTREVPVKVQFVGNYSKNIKVKEVRIRPQRVKIFGFKSRIQSINIISTLEPVDRSKITETITLTLDLKKREEILRFEDVKSVEVTIVVETYDQRK